MAVPPGWATRAFFALADNHGVLLRGLLPDDEDLEELFHRVLAATGPDRRTAVMGDTPGRAGPPELLHYRPWKGTFRPPVAAVWPIARTGLRCCCAAGCSGACTPSA